MTLTLLQMSVVGWKEYGSISSPHKKKHSKRIYVYRTYSMHIVPLILKSNYLKLVSHCYFPLPFSGTLKPF